MNTFSTPLCGWQRGQLVDGAPLTSRRHRRRGSCNRSAAACPARPRAGLLDSLQQLASAVERELDFERWAPRSSRAWRLRERPTEVSVVPTSDRLAASESAPLPAVDDPTPLTALELAQACFRKYDKYHDIAIKHTRVNAGLARWVALNVYVGHLGQRSFPYTEEEYLEKLEAVAYMINKWDQVEYVRAFFAEPPIPRRGLPSRPRVDTAVSLRLNSSPTWNEALLEGFFLEDEELDAAASERRRLEEAAAPE